MFGRARKLPRLEPLLRKLAPERARRRTPAELLAIAERINAMLGGTDRRERKGG